MSVIKRIAVLISALVIGAVVVSGCSATTSTPNGQEAEAKSGQKSYDNLVAADPAHTMTYSSTRKTINFWVDTWGKRGKLAYTYLMNSEGKVIGYYVTEGPPVSMCTSIRPGYKVIKGDNGMADGVVPLVVPAPSTDGVYYSGGECNTYYAKDAATGAYIQFTAGMGINPLLYDQPLSPSIVKGAPNLGQHK